MCERGADPNLAVSKGKLTLLFIATEQGHVPVMDALVEHGAHVDSPIPRPAIIWAAGQGHLEATQLLIRAGANVNAVDENCWTALDHAIAGKHDEIVQALRAAGASGKFDQRLVQGKALEGFFEAARSGDCKAVRDALEGDLDLKFATSGWIALGLAALGGYVGVVELLLEKGAAVNGSDYLRWSPLTLASRTGHVEIVEMLLLAGAEASRESLRAAVEGGYSQVVKLILNEDGVATHRSSLDQSLCEACRQGNLEIVALLLKSGANVNAKTQDKASALHLACQAGQLAVVEELITAGAQVNEE